MKKVSVTNNISIENGVTAILIVNAAILMGITLHKKYKSQLEKLARQYVKLKAENPSKAKRQEPNYKKEVTELFEKAKTVIGDVGNLLVDAMKTCSAQDIPKYSLISENVATCICQKLETTKIVQPKRPKTLALTSVGPSITITEITEKAKIVGQEFLTLPSMNSKVVIPEVVNQSIGTLFLRDLCVTLALISAFNSLAIPAQEVINIDTAIIQDTEEFLNEIEIDSSILNFQSEIEEVREWTVEQQITVILSSSNTYEAKMDQILKLTGLSLDEAISIIMHLNITTYENVFNYILSIQGLENYKKMGYIINSSIATFEEKVYFIMNLKDISIEQKIWYVLLIPNVSFETAWNTLFEIEGMNQDEIVKSVIDTDMVSFDVLFDNILKLEGLTKEALTNYLAYYHTHASYNENTDEEMFQYILNLEFFTRAEQLDSIWTLFSNYSLNKRINIILDHYNMTYEDYLNLYAVKNNLTEEQSIVWNLMERVNAKKEEYVLENYFDSKEQLDETNAICAAEGAKKYKDLYWVASTILNRIANPHYIKLYGPNPYSQVTAYKQFTVYESGLYWFYLYPRNFDYELQYDLARQAVLDVFYGGSDVTAHNFVEFRSWNTEDFSNIYAVNGGNRYNTPINPEKQVKHTNPEEQDDIDYEWVKTLRYDKK